MNHTFICCGLADDPPEVQSTNSSDRLQSDGGSSPLDCHSLKREEGGPESPSPAHSDGATPPMAPTQPFYLNGDCQVRSLHLHLSKFVSERLKVFFVCAPPEPRMTGFHPYYKPSYAWEPVPSSYELHQMSFNPTVLQHASSLYSSHISCTTQPQQPLDCSTHYSPTSNTYHCITCDKVSHSWLRLACALGVFI